MSLIHALRRRSRVQSRLRFEPLENRLMLSGGTTDDGLLPDGSDPGAAALARFASAEELEDYLIQDALERYQGQFGQPGYYWYCRGGVYLDGAVNTFGGVPEANPTHSDTNTQVAGVDEGDIVETDGEYLYVLSGQEVVIIDAWPADEMAVTSRVTIEGYPFAEYLNGDTLTVLSRDYRYDDGWPPIEPMPMGGGILAADAMFAPYYYPSQAITTVSVFDVSDREAPALVRETELEGNYVDSRAIGSNVYLVLRDDFVLPGPIMLPVPDDQWKIQDPTDPNASPGGSFAPDIWPPPEYRYVYETEEQYLARIEGQVLELALPEFFSYDAAGELMESGLLSEATDVYRPISPDYWNLMSVVVYDTAADPPGPISSTSVPADYTSEVYMSMENLYLLQNKWTSDGTMTQILKFPLDDPAGGLDLSAIGTVHGRVLNQFAVDEYDGYLRIAVTGGPWRETLNSVYVLAQDGESLEVVGSVTDLAQGEQIYSARFLGDRGYVVTFRQVDPLFVLDLSDPTAPAVTGELKITGFSNYLHDVGDDFLLGLGRDADPVTGLYQDPQVSLFYVGIASHPMLADRYTMDTGRAGGMNLFDDHHAISYFPEYQILAVPIPSYGYNNDWCRYRYQYDLWVFRIDKAATDDGNTADGTADGNILPQGDIELMGRVEHKTSIRRSVRIGEVLYSISDSVVSAHSFDDLETAIKTLVFKAEPLGVIDGVILPNVDLSTGERWFQFQTDQPGLLTLGTDGNAPVAVELYAGNGQLLEPPPGGQLQWQVGAGETYFFSLRGDDSDPNLTTNSTTVDLAIVAPGTVVGRHVFYNNSALDGNDPAAGPGDAAAIASGKTALLPGETATFDNYTNYSRGINGLMIDVDHLPQGYTPDAGHFVFKVGNDDQPAGWADAPGPNSITLQRGAGEGGSDRITVTWDDGAIVNQWLEVTMPAGLDTWLGEEDVFYFGNAVAESGNSDADARVTTIDLLLTRNNPRSFLNPAPVDFAFDFNRDGRVNTTDVLLARNSQTNFTNALKLVDFSAPAEPAAAASVDMGWLYQFDPSDADESDGPAPVGAAVDLLLA
ncbi:MAG TPA: beta-propeller domain-containing protein [Thermoguttaceae bacterium]|nr:beta-propeller domain-containing protein [Thermoguttaceae bacterium]